MYMEEINNKIKRNSRVSSQKFMIQSYQDHDFVRITKIGEDGILTAQEYNHDEYFELYKLMVAHFTNVIDAFHLENLDRSIETLKMCKASMQRNFKHKK